MKQILIDLQSQAFIFVREKKNPIIGIGNINRYKLFDIAKNRKI
jgi:hypothetical protein